jgi:hypothetical protein
MALFKNRRKRSVALIAAAGLTVAGTGVAFAYWTSTGDGVGTATTGTSVVFDITSAGPVGDPLTPGGPTQTNEFTVTNPSSGVQTLTAVTVVVANADGSAWNPAGACSASDYTATITTPPAYGAIAPGGSQTGTASITMIETGENQDSCKTLTVPLYFQADALV